jgi:cardiolipin synthase A/B
MSPIHRDSLLITYLASALHVAISLVASGHVLLHKRDTKAAIGWIGLIWLSPIMGTALYVVLGINRIKRRAKSLRRGQARAEPPAERACDAEEVERTLTAEGVHLSELVELVGHVTGRPLLAGNAVEPLDNGDVAYPAMIRAIDEAARSVSLSTYLFGDDRAGRMFVEALGRAVARGVEVRVLVDDIGARYGWRTIFGPLRRAGVRAAAFMPSLAPGFMPYLNLRNHRKILVVDGRVGFTGGLNINEDFFHQVHPRRPKHDLHFRVRGPVVATLQHTFADDWAFATRELLHGEAWFPPLDEVGPVLARGVADGPDDERDDLLLVLLGALAAARSSVAVVTPYFLPDAALMSALEVAALRGVQVDILLPSQNNLRTVQWASTALLGQVLEGGCRVWYSPPPFDHTKLMVVDRAWSFLGSANWDTRSLRLNFELNIECYSPPLAATLDRWFRDRLARAEPVTPDQINGRSLLVKLRDGAARLLSPYL